MLDKVYNKIKISLKAEVHDTECYLVHNGWSNVSNTPVIASSIHFHGKSYFVDAVDCTSNHKTAEYCAKLAKISIQFALTEYGTKVTTFVTDNCNVINATRDILKLEFEDLICNGCSQCWQYLNTST